MCMLTFYFVIFFTRKLYKLYFEQIFAVLCSLLVPPLFASIHHIKLELTLDAVLHPQQRGAVLAHMQPYRGAGPRALLVDDQINVLCTQPTAR